MAKKRLYKHFGKAGSKAASKLKLPQPMDSAARKQHVAESQKKGRKKLQRQMAKIRKKTGGEQGNFH